MGHKDSTLFKTQLDIQTNKTQNLSDNQPEYIYHSKSAILQTGEHQGDLWSLLPSKQGDYSKDISQLQNMTNPHHYASPITNELHMDKLQFHAQSTLPFSLLHKH